MSDFTKNERAKAIFNNLWLYQSIFLLGTFLFLTPILYKTPENILLGVLVLLLIIGAEMMIFRRWRTRNTESDKAYAKATQNLDVVSTFSPVFSILNDAVVIADKNFLIRYTNQSFLDLFQESDLDCQDKHLGNFIDPQYLLTDSVRRYVLLETGQEIFLQGKITPDPFDPGKEYVIFIFHQNLHDQTETYAHWLSLMGKGMRDVAYDYHDFLETIFENIKHIENTDDLGKIHKNFLPKIMKATQDADLLTAQILNHTYKLSKKATRITLSEMFDRIQKLAEPLIGSSHKIHIVDKTAQETEIFMDPDMLEISLVQLIINARDALIGGGDIVITTRNVEGFIQIIVQDSGARIVTHNLTHTEHDQRLHGDHDKEENLLMIKDVIERCGGHLLFNPIPNFGTETIMLIPKPMQESSHLSVKMAHTSAQPAKKKILVVDDNPSLRKSLALQLHLLGYDVVTTENLDACYACEDSESFDLVLSDMILTKETGLDIWRHFQKMKYPARFVFMTGNIPSDLLKEFQDLTPGELLRKPFDMAKLDAALKRAFATPS